MKELTTMAIKVASGLVSNPALVSDPDYQKDNGGNTLNIISDPRQKEGYIKFISELSVDISNAIISLT